MSFSQFKILVLLVVLQLIGTESYSQIDSGYVRVKGADIFYRIWGEGEPIVFLNGGPGLGSQGYEVYATGIEHNRKVILFDQRGTGKSKLRNRSKVFMYQMVKDIESLRKHLGIEKWDVFGHSFGGEYAINYILRYAKSINKVILSASPGLKERSFTNFQKFKEPETENLSKLENQLYKELEEERKKVKPNQNKIRRYTSALKARFYVSKPENYKKVVDWWLYKANPNTYRIDISGRDGSLNRKIKKLRKFENQILIIHGIGDFINISHPISTHSIFPNSQLKIIQDSGHMMSLDSKEAYFKTINQFLEGK